MKKTFITYLEYMNDYDGKIIPQSSFDIFAKQASSKVNYYTFNRIIEIDNNVIFAACEIAELLYEQNQLKLRLNDDNNIVASETVGPHSKTYVNKSNLQSKSILSNKELEQECYNICLRHLGSTGLMYRGI